MGIVDRKGPNMLKYLNLSTLVTCLGISLCMLSLFGSIHGVLVYTLVNVCINGYYVELIVYIDCHRL